jgi:hypothetical protein
MRRLRRWVVLALVVCSLSRSSRAAPWGNGEPSAGLWLALTGFVSLGNVNDVGFIVTGSVPLDALAQKVGPASARSLADPPVTVPAPPPVERPPKPMLTPALARDAVGAAWRFAHVAEDGRFTALATRASTSALLPEVRFSVMRTTRDGSGADTTTTGSPYSLYYADRTVLEGRVLFRLDRLVFAEDEVAIERLRADAILERERIAHRVLEELARWQRAQIDLTSSPSDSAERVEAALRVIEAESALDVLTGGWFSHALLSLPETP